ncbi:MAG: hypothetical protein NZZ41_05515 [Candidatus Dojkabacteria bacterium]|nr:hypothetical protein [Candidatus Dojkabacteria bacterium]
MSLNLQKLVDILLEHEGKNIKAKNEFLYEARDELLKCDFYVAAQKLHEYIEYLKQNDIKFHEENFYNSLYDNNSNDLESYYEE